MSDIDRVFARLGGAQPTSTEQRELRHIPRKGGSTGSRVVEVVRLPTKGAPQGEGGARRSDVRLRAATWEDGFPARSALPPQAAAPVEIGTAAPPAAEPVAHVMPVWQRRVEEPEVAAAPPPPPDAAPPAPAPRRAGRRVADPYDMEDDGANCLRCGYAVQPARARRGLMTCAGCG
jgi:hypothetical protein